MSGLAGPSGLFSIARERFGIAPQNSAIASRIIRDTLAAKLIIPHGDARGKYAKYAPFWS